MTKQPNPTLMLLAGLAMDSPADAVAVHPGLVSGEKQIEGVRAGRV